MMRNGYILLNPILKHKRFIYNWDEINGLKKEFTQDFWTEYRKEKELDSAKFHEELKPKVRKYFVEIGKFKFQNKFIDCFERNVKTLVNIVYYESGLEIRNHIFVII